MLIVCGSGRSGTSAVARMLHCSGIPVGHDLIEADEHNAEGYFEERKVVLVNDAILLAVGMERWFVTASRAEIVAAAQQYRSYMDELVAEATPAWKDPRFCWTLEPWMEVLPERPRVIVCLRSPAEVVASTMRYYGLDGDEPRRAVEHTWRGEYERLLEVIDEYALDAISIEFGALYADPEGAAAPLAEFVGRPLDASLVRRDLRHHALELQPELAELYARVAALGR
jgi:hypothetical protein